MERWQCVETWCRPLALKLLVDSNNATLVRLQTFIWTALSSCPLPSNFQQRCKIKKKYYCYIGLKDFVPLQRSVSKILKYFVKRRFRRIDSRRGFQNLQDSDSIAENQRSKIISDQSLIRSLEVSNSVSIFCFLIATNKAGCRCTILHIISMNTAVDISINL